MMDFEQSHQELVKCVVVGDTAVGKTRLICAKACNLILDLSQLMTTHIPTVWAIDQYRIHKDVLERSWEIVDGVNVSLRLWDTFGDHDKDRRFAYGRSDVVLLCFSIANPLSLRNCRTVWLPEIRKFCPNTPIVLVGCKNDLRYMFHDEQFQNLCRERSPFYRVKGHLCYRFPECGRTLKECDILSPEQGRNMAKELNASYYETSVFTGYGVKHLFENVIRAALIARRQQRFLMTNLKHVRNCLLQEPFLPPKPHYPQLLVPKSTYVQDIESLLHRRAYTDVQFINDNDNNDDTNTINCHKIILISASDILNTIFTTFSTYFNDDHNQNQIYSPNCRKSNLNTYIDSLLTLSSLTSSSSSTSTTSTIESNSNLKKYSSELSISSLIPPSSIKANNPKDSLKYLFIDDSILENIRYKYHSKFVADPIGHNQCHNINQNQSNHPHQHQHHQNTLTLLQQSKYCFKLFQQKFITFYRNGRNNSNYTNLDELSCDDTNDNMKSPVKHEQRSTIISFGDNIPFDTLNLYIKLLYSLSSTAIPSDHQQLNQLYKCLSLYLDFIDFDFQDNSNNVCDNHDDIDYSDISLMKNFFKNIENYFETAKLDRFVKRFAHFAIDQGLFSDVIFRLDDGICYGHKAILMARCEVMEAMFKGDFRESSAEEIVFPNVTRDTFYNMLYYIYTDTLSDQITHSNCLQLIELANRFCLLRLIGLIEERIVNELMVLIDSSNTTNDSSKQKLNDYITPTIIRLLEPSQIHNADQLTEFCLYYLTTNYNDICHQHLKLLRSLHPENQAYLNRNRWPPLWYLKELDYFEYCCRVAEWQQNPRSKSKYKLRRNGFIDRIGCFCFGSSKNNSRQQPCQQHPYLIHNTLNKTSNILSTSSTTYSSSGSSTYSSLTYKIIGFL